MDRRERFLGRFALPLLAGGEVHVGRPLDRDDLEALCRITAAGSALAAELEQHWRARAAELWLWPSPPCVLERGSLRLLSAAHNILALGHPDLEPRLGRGRALQRVEAFTRACLAAPVPADQAILVARHALLERLLDLSRRDVTVRFWLGRERFLGTEPPARFTAWPSLRRVEQEARVTQWLQSGLSVTQENLLEGLLQQSPVTDLLSPHRSRPPFSWLHIYRTLASPRLCRLVAYELLQIGLPVVEPPMVAAFWELYAEPLSRLRSVALRTVLHFLLYLQTLELLAPAPAVGPESTNPQLEQRREGATLLVAAARLGLLPGEAQLCDAAVARRLEKRVERWQRRLAPERLAEVSGWLADAVGPGGGPEVV